MPGVSIAIDALTTKNVRNPINQIISLRPMWSSYSREVRGFVPGDPR